MSEIQSADCNNQSAKKPVLIKLRKLKPSSKSLPVKSIEEHMTPPPQLTENSNERVKSPQGTAKEETPATSNPLSGEIECEFCHIKLPNISKAIYHKYVRHRREGHNHSCEFCGRLFAIRIALDHHKQNSHKAELAGKHSIVPENSNSEGITQSNSTNSRLQLESTADVSKDFEFPCKMCPATFLSGDALKFHENQVHGHKFDLLQQIFLPPPSTKIRVNHNSEVFSVYYCYLCGCEYVLKYNFKKHIHDHHSIEERTAPPPDGIIRCTLCESIFYTKKAYDAHSVHHRADDLYVTSEEHRKKVVNRVDQDFDFRRIPEKYEFFQSKRRKFFTPMKSQIDKKVDSVDKDETLSPPTSPSESSDDEDGACTSRDNVEDD